MKFAKPFLFMFDKNKPQSYMIEAVKLPFFILLTVFLSGCLEETSQSEKKPATGNRASSTAVSTLTNTPGNITVNINVSPEAIQALTEKDPIIGVWETKFKEDPNEYTMQYTFTKSDAGLIAIRKTWPTDMLSGIPVNFHFPIFLKNGKYEGKFAGKIGVSENVRMEFYFLLKSDDSLFLTEKAFFPDGAKFDVPYTLKKKQ